MKKKSRNNTKNFNPQTLVRVMAVLLIITALGGTIYFFQKVFSIKTINCLLATQSQCPAELQQATNTLLGHSMFFEDYTQVLLESQTVTQPVSLVTIEKRLPNTIKLVFQPEPSKYAISWNGEITTVSQSGKVFVGNSPHEGLLMVETNQPLEAGNQQVDADMHHTITTILDTTASLNLPLTAITWVDKSTIQLSMENREELFIVDSISPTLQLHKISLILKSSEYREIAEAKQQLDVRFNMPVLRTQP